MKDKNKLFSNLAPGSYKVTYKSGKTEKVKIFAKNNIEIVVRNDYDGYFEDWAKELSEELIKIPNNKIDKIIVDSGPYRSHGLTYEVNGNTVVLDFYSAVRSGFGSIGITPKDLASDLND